MRAAIVEDGVVTNVIVVQALEDFPGCIEGSDAAIGDSWDGEVFTRPALVIPPGGEAKQQIAALEATVTPRRIREAVISAAGEAWLVAVDDQIAVLRKALAL